jgi:hydroxymethylpyrimidine pyrophosphatase-like HAD family hydrolase
VPEQLLVPESSGTRNTPPGRRPDEERTLGISQPTDGQPFVRIPDRPHGILALDIDGTLVGPPDWLLTDRTKRAVHAAGAAGWLVTIATGRPWQRTKPIADELGLEIPLIASNGAEIRDSLTGELLLYNPLPEAATGPLVRACVARGLQPVLDEDLRVGERILTGPIEHDGELTGPWLARISAIEPVVRLSYDELASVETALRIFVYDDADRLQGIETLAADLGLECYTLFYPVEDHPNSAAVEFLHPHGTKAAALRVLADRFGLTMDEVIAVGDGYNDLEMLAEAGIGVAMGQAPADIHARADLAIGGAVDEGLAAFIEEVLLAGPGFPHHLRPAPAAARSAAG